MTKAIKTIIKLQVTGGQANPAPPVGPALGQHGLNIAEFCKKFNEVTKDRMGEVTPVQITVYQDRTYDFVLKKPPASEMIKKAAGIQKGSGKSAMEKVGKITRTQVKEIAEQKISDLNTDSIEAAMRTIEGTARQMGVTITD